MQVGSPRWRKQVSHRGIVIKIRFAHFPYRKTALAQRRSKLFLFGTLLSCAVFHFMPFGVFSDPPALLLCSTALLDRRNREILTGAMLYQNNSTIIANEFRKDKHQLSRWDGGRRALQNKSSTAQIPGGKASTIDQYCDSCAAPFIGIEPSKDSPWVFRIQYITLSTRALSSILMWRRRSRLAWGRGQEVGLHTPR